MGRALFKIILCISLFYPYWFSLSALEREKELEIKIRNLVSDHPSILAKLHGIREKKYIAEHADVYPDPKIGFSYRSYPYRNGPVRERTRPDTPGMTGNEISISQEIPFPGKLSLEKQIKKLDAEVEIHEVEWNLNTFLKTLFEIKLSISALEKEIQNLESLVLSLKSTSKLEASGYSAGKTNLTPTLKLLNIREKISDRILQKKTNLEQLRSKLNYFEANEKLNILESEEILEYLKLKEVGFEKGIGVQHYTHSSILKISDLSVSKVDAEIERDRILHFPDTEIFFSYMQRRNRPFLLDSGPLNYSIMDNPEYSGDLWSAGITMRIPVWSITKQSELDKSNSFKRRRIFEEREEQKRFLESELKIAWENWRGNKERSENFQKNVLKTFKQGYTSSLTAYSKGDIALSESLQFLNESIEMNSFSYEIELGRWTSLMRMLEITNSLMPELKEN